MSDDFPIRMPWRPQKPKAPPALPPKGPANSNHLTPMLEDVFADHCDLCSEWHLDCLWIRDLRSDEEMVACSGCRLNTLYVAIEADHRPARR